MRVVLQNNSSSLYFCYGAGNWTPSFREAYNFGQAHKAIEYAHLEGWSDVQVVVVMEEDAHLEFIPFQIHPAPGQTVRPQPAF